jgi:PhnO protein
MINNLKIRKVEQKDMLTVYEQIFLLEDFIFNINTFENIFNHNIEDKNILYYMAESHEGEALGFISCHIQNILHHCGKVAEIQELFIKQAFRGQKIGEQLVKFIEQELIALDCISFEVTAQNKRIATHEFYCKMGFTSSHLKFTKSLS